jgi:uncharacterized protein with FMN-binding domain
LLRALLTLGGTAAGIAALVAVKFQPAAATASAAGPQSLAAPVATAPAAAPSVAPHSARPLGARKPSASPKPRSSPSGASSTASSAGGTGGTTQSTTARTFTGAVDDTQYGPMQVAITVSGKTITKITVVQQTNNGSESTSIDATALPKLTSEALAAQSAKIDAVSGASYTSAGYIQSLQSAIDQSGL